MWVEPRWLKDKCLRFFSRHYICYLLSKRQRELNCTSVTDFISVVSGDFSPTKLTLFSIFRNEIYFCQAFFDHYRRIGVDQFLILDDGSTDGTELFLRSQPDCVILTSTLSFGQLVPFRLPHQAADFGRAGIAFKSLIPHHFILDSYALYADADEYLILPESAASLSEVIERLDQLKVQAVVGPLIEFFPSSLPTPGTAPEPPESFDQLVDKSSYFEATPLVILDPDRGFCKTGRTKSELLFERFKVKRRLGLRRPTSPRFKTPILRHGPEAFRIGSHKASVPASTDVLLPMAHFVFTENFFAKIERAIAHKSHAGRSAKYFYYGQLVKKILDMGADLRGSQSRLFRSARDLIESGHMKWP